MKICLNLLLARTCCLVPDYVLRKTDKTENQNFSFANFTFQTSFERHGHQAQET